MKITFITGAGISTASGIPPFRGDDGIFTHNPELQKFMFWGNILSDKIAGYKFLNNLKASAINAHPNRAHRIIAMFDRQHEVTVITQNIDDLHEQANSKHIIHLHGSIFHVRQQDILFYTDSDKIYHPTLFNVEQKTITGEALRPAIVFADEWIENYDIAMSAIALADAVVFVGTSFYYTHILGFLGAVKNRAQLYIIDVRPLNNEVLQTIGNREFSFLQTGASEGLQQVFDTIQDCKKSQ